MPPPKRSFRPSPPDPETRAWSPGTPPFREESWRRERRMTPEEAAPYIAALKAKVGAIAPPTSAPPLDQVQAQKYLDACEARQRDEPDIPPF